LTFCTRCGTQNETNARFCRQCASPLGASSPSGSGQQTETPYPGYQGTQNPGFQGQTPPAMPAPVYGQSYPNASNTSGGASGRAIAALVCMILSFVFCGPFTGIPAIILGKQEMDAIKRGEASRAGDGLAKAGFYGGIVSVVLTCGGFLLAFAMIGFGGIMGALGQ
jgi:Domain of unknown function (DUF4190)/zinc-ribbon domain